MIIHGTKDSVVSLEDGEKLSSNLSKDYLYEFLKVENGDHNDLYKNFKSRIFKKIREFLNHISSINFNEYSKIDSEFFKRLHPSENKNNENELLNNIIIREFIEESPENMVSQKYEDNIEEIRNEDVILEIKNIEINNNNFN
jgi:hypothetical protein